MTNLDYRLACVPLAALVALLGACDPAIEDVDDSDSAAEDDSDSGQVDPDDPDPVDPDPDPDPDPVDPDPEPDTDGEATTGGSGGVDPVEPGLLEEGGVALRFEDLPEIDPGMGGSSTTTTGGEPAHDPQALVVELSTLDNSCEDPSPLMPCGEHASITLIIEPDQQVVGTYVLFEQVDGFAMATGPIPSDDPEDCWGGGGTLGGVLEILAIDENHIAGRLTDTDAFDFDANVAFSVPICG